MSVRRSTRLGNCLFQPRLVEVRPRRITDEKLPARTERGHDGMLHQRRRRGHLGNESVGQINRRRGGKEA